ncbi:MAG: TonB-dependent receptor [Opitutaceae bacterium]|nr:TonB-dependent receptor [Opitutaceae bacterium]
MNIRMRKFTAALSLFAGAAVSPSALAQPAANKPEETVKLEKFTVTGTLIPVAAGSTTVPLTIIGAPELEKTGITTDLIDVLRSSLPSLYGANNLGSDVGNVNSGDSNGGSAISLRNRSTLVLINGRRAATSPVAATGGSTFVDVSTIPFSAIERVEILTDGASALYGSDAVSGVVNIILKKNYNGAEIGGSYSFSTNKGHWANRSYYMVGGATVDKTSVLFTTEWKKSDPLIQYERPYSTGLFRTPSFAGVIDFLDGANGQVYYTLNPSLNAPGLNLDLTPSQLVANGTYRGPMDQTAASQVVDLASYPTLLLKAERRSFTTAIEHRLTPDLTLFGDLIYSLNNTESVLNAQPVTGVIAANHPSNPFNIPVTARNRFLKFPRIYANETTNIHGVVGAKGKIAGDWTFEAGANFNKSIHNFRNRNLIDATAYFAAVANQTFNAFARNQAPGVIEGMLGTQVRDFFSTLRQLDVQAAGTVFRLPAGDVKLGVGAGFVWEELDFTNDRNDQTGNWLQATPRQPFNARQNVDGFYAEVRVPIFSERSSVPFFRTLEASIAGRYDKYSTTSDPTTPKYSIRWLPFNDELMLRATYSESFVAPTLYQLYGPLSQGFTASINIPRYNSAGQPLGTNSGQRQYRQQTGSNRNLNPSESRNWTAGVVWSPKVIKGLSISADWFNIDERDLISTIPAITIVTDVERRGPASPFASLVRQGTSVAGELYFGTGAAITAPGQVTGGASDAIWLTTTNVNVTGYNQDGMDVKVTYDLPTQNWGKVRGTVMGTYIRNYYVQDLPTVAPRGYQDGFYQRGTNSNGVFPRYRLNNRLDWTFKNIGAGIGHTYIPSLDDLGSIPSVRVRKYHKFDVQASYAFGPNSHRWLKGLSATVGVNNVFNKFPPRIPSEGNQSHDINAYDPIGRLVYVQAKYKF